MLNGSPVWKTIQICMVGKLKSIVHLKQSKVAVFWELTLDYTVKHHWISEKGFSAGNYLLANIFIQSICVNWTIG